MKRLMVVIAMKIVLHHQLAPHTLCSVYSKEARELHDSSAFADVMLGRQPELSRLLKAACKRIDSWYCGINNAVVAQSVCEVLLGLLTS